MEFKHFSAIKRRSFQSNVLFKERMQNDENVCLWLAIPCLCFWVLLQLKQVPFKAI